MDEMRASGTAGGGQLLRLVGFRIEDWRFAIRLEQVQTSLMPCGVTRVFNTPPFVRGVMSLRGTIVCVLDLGILLGLGRSGAAHHRLLVVSVPGTQAAIPVHDVFRLPEIPASRVEPLPASVDPAHRMLLEGVINTSGLAGMEGAREETLTLIDAATLFGSPQLQALRGKGVRP